MRIRNPTFLVEFKALIANKEQCEAVDKACGSFNREVEQSFEIQLVDALPHIESGHQHVTVLYGGEISTLSTINKEVAGVKITLIPILKPTDNFPNLEFDVKKRSNDCGVFWTVENKKTRFHFTIKQDEGGAELAKLLIASKYVYFQERGELDIFTVPPHQHTCPRCDYPKPDKRKSHIYRRLTAVQFRPDKLFK